MSKAGYMRTRCEYCGKEISTSGGGVTHYRKHVREGILREIKPDFRARHPRVRFEPVRTAKIT